MAQDAFSVPGYAGQCEFPERMSLVDGVRYSDAIGRRYGGGVLFRGKAGQFNFFHFAVPTPVMKSDIRIRLGAVFVLFKLGDGARATRVVIYEGPRILVSHDINATGDHSQDLDDSNNWLVPGNPRLRSGGVGISFRVTFDREADVRFTSAGAEFQS